MIFHLNMNHSHQWNVEKGYTFNYPFIQQIQIMKFTPIKTSKENQNLKERLWVYTNARA